MTSIENILFLLLGWVLGLFSPVIYDEVKKRQHRKEIKLGILTELKEFRFKLTGVVYLTEERFGTYDRELLNWLKLIINDYKGTHRKDRIFKALEEHLKLSDKELSDLSQQSKGTMKNAFHMKKYELPFLTSKMDSLTVFDESFQNKIFEIRSQLNILHEEVDQSRFYFEKSFDSTLTDENHNIIIANLENTYRNISQRSRRLADRVGELITDKGFRS